MIVFIFEEEMTVFSFFQTEPVFWFEVERRGQRCAGRRKCLFVVETNTRQRGCGSFYVMSQASQSRRCKKLEFSPCVGENPLEEGMATRSRILPWGIPRTEEPGGLQSMGSQRVGYN